VTDIKDNYSPVETLIQLTVIDLNAQSTCTGL